MTDTATFAHEGGKFLLIQALNPVLALIPGCARRSQVTDMTTFGRTTDEAPQETPPCVWALSPDI